MKVPTKTIENSVQIQKQTAATSVPAKPELSFKSIYDAIATPAKGAGLSFDAPMAEIAKIKGMLQKSKVISAEDLLLYQIQISDLNMRVELLSKTADSAVAVTRKLQNAQ